MDSMRKWFNNLDKKQRIELYRTIGWSGGSLGTAFGGANAAGIGLANTFLAWAIFAIIIFITFRVFRILNIKHPFQ
tara:strand:+ start:18 stop:245 length:228 start_codon:yes stop_codon:yes gene_type:complete